MKDGLNGKHRSLKIFTRVQVLENRTHTLFSMATGYGIFTLCKSKRIFSPISQSFDTFQNVWNT